MNTETPIKFIDPQSENISVQADIIKYFFIKESEKNRWNDIPVIIAALDLIKTILKRRNYPYTLQKIHESNEELLKQEISNLIKKQYGELK